MIQMYKNTPLYYSSAGFGNPVVFLHGFLESSSIWNPFVDELSKKRQVVCIDLPGHGKSGTFGEIHTMEFMAEAVYEILNKLKIEKATFVGHSLGGYVSLAFYKKFPIITRGLVLLNSTPESDTEERKKNRDRAIKIVKRNKESYVSMAISNLLNPKNKELFTEDIEKLKEEAFGFSENGIVAALEGMKIRTDSKDFFAEFKGLKYIVAGEEDPILNYIDIKRVAKLCNSNFKSFSNGHLSFIENKNELQNLLHLID